MSAPYFAALLLASAPAMTAVDAERAFAADARKLGQWTAFRRWAAEDAVMFAPHPVRTQVYLKDRKDPAEALDWWPTASYVSCDGSLAVNTGGWKAPGGTVGYFTTVWQRQKDGGWKWIVDGGDDLKVARDRPREVGPSLASCTGKPTSVPSWAYEHVRYTTERGISTDGTLAWDRVDFPNTNGRREFHAYLWNGSAWDNPITDSVGGAPRMEIGMPPIQIPRIEAHPAR